MSAVASSSSGRVPQGEVVMEVGFMRYQVCVRADVAVRRWRVIYQALVQPPQADDVGAQLRCVDKLENAVVELERKKITREEGQKAAKAMEALNVNQTSAKAEDVDLIVSYSVHSSPRRTTSPS